MVLSTAQSRSAWYPACRSKGGTYLNAYRALDACLRRYGYKPGYGTGAFACRRITGGSGNSLHAYGPGTEFRFWNGYRIPSTALAVDINPPQNPYGRRLVTNMPRPMVDAIVRIRTNNGKQVWGWGGYFRRNKDAMHYEIVCSRTDLASGINAATLPGGTAAPPPPQEDDMTPDQDKRLTRIEADAERSARVSEANSNDINLVQKTLGRVIDKLDDLIAKG